MDSDTLPTAKSEILNRVQQLYDLKNRFFVGKDLKTLTENRDVSVEKQVLETLAFIEVTSESLEGKDRTIASFAKGKTLNIRQEYSEEAFENLSRTVKMSPNMTEAWIELGNCFWKKGDIDNALNCFESAKKLDPKNKECLRSLSIVTRSIRPTSDKNLIERLEKSLSLAKEAVEIDMTDGSSWTILGNAYLTLYCSSPRQDTSLLRQCKVAYTRAKGDPIEASQPDFL